MIAILPFAARADAAYREQRFAFSKDRHLDECLHSAPDIGQWIENNEQGAGDAVIALLEACSLNDREHIYNAAMRLQRAIEAAADPVAELLAEREQT